MSMKKASLLGLFFACSAAAVQAATEEASFEKARESARIAGYSLSKVQRWLHEKCLPAIDPATELYNMHCVL